MSSRPLIEPLQAITNGDMSADVISKIMILTNISLASFAVLWVGTSPVGDLNIEVSNDYSLNVDGSVRNAGHWVALSSLTQHIASNSGSGVFEIDKIGTYAMRLHYTRTSGSGTLQAFFMGKVQ